MQKPDDKEVIAQLVAGLKEAKETIKIWHGDVAWEIYDRCSPEMKRLNFLIDKYGDQ
jgi:hypothetical protein